MVVVVEGGWLVMEEKFVFFFAPLAAFIPYLLLLYVAPPGRPRINSRHGPSLLNSDRPELIR